jgi:two-component system, OmpR family, response regulator
MPNILIVEDNRHLASSLTQGLCEQGLQARAVHRGADAITLLETMSIDLVVLDLGLPDIDGLAVLEQCRRRGNHAPVLVLTARDAVEMRVAALEAGADDYMVKPFALAELVARVRALARRASGPRWSSVRLGAVVIEDDFVVRGPGCEVSLSPREHALLGYLARRHGEVAPRADILGAVFGYHFDTGTNVIDVHVASLRRKLAALPVSIRTVRGCGFKLEMHA